mgnify:CR=1 FL=1
MENKKEVASGGIGICTLLFLLFLGLKLGGIGQVAHWSWWWVTSPLWIPWAIVLAVLLIVAIFVIIVGLINRYN